MHGNKLMLVGCQKHKKQCLLMCIDNLAHGPYISTNNLSSKHIEYLSTSMFVVFSLIHYNSIVTSSLAFLKGVLPSYAFYGRNN